MTVMLEQAFTQENIVTSQLHSVKSIDVYGQITFLIMSVPLNSTSRTDIAQLNSVVCTYHKYRTDLWPLAICCQGLQTQDDYSRGYTCIQTSLKVYDSSQSYGLASSYCPMW